MSPWTSWIWQLKIQIWNTEKLSDGISQAGRMNINVLQAHTYKLWNNIKSIAQLPFFKLLSFLADTRYKFKNQKCSTQLPRHKCKSHLWSAEISFLASSCLSSRARLSRLSCAMLASPLDIIWNNLAFFWCLFLDRQIEPEMCTMCRTGAMSDSTVSLCFSGLAKNAILIQSCNPASNNSFLKLRKGPCNISAQMLHVW